MDILSDIWSKTPLSVVIIMLFFLLTLTCGIIFIFKKEKAASTSDEHSGGHGHANEEHKHGEHGGGHGHGSEEKHQGTFLLITKIALGILVMMAIFVLFGRFIYNIFSGPKHQTAYQETETSQVAGMHKVTYRFSEYWDKTIRVTLRSNAEFYPKGGVIKITAPSGKSWNDEPGVAIVRPPERPGEYIITLPKNSTAWGVEIWN